MSPGASLYELPPNNDRDQTAIVWASVIAIVFALVAAISFAVDQSITLSSLPVPPAHSITR